MASLRLAKVMTQTAIFMPFEDTRKLVHEFTGLKLSVTFIENTVVHIGDTLYHKAEAKGKRPYVIKGKEKDVETTGNDKWISTGNFKQNSIYNVLPVAEVTGGYSRRQFGWRRYSAETGYWLLDEVRRSLINK